jgi:hypothetical protein
MPHYYFNLTDSVTRQIVLPFPEHGLRPAMASEFTQRVSIEL